MKTCALGRDNKFRINLNQTCKYRRKSSNALSHEILPVFYRFLLGLVVRSRISAKPGLNLTHRGQLFNLGLSKPAYEQPAQG